MQSQDDECLSDGNKLAASMSDEDPSRVATGFKLFAVGLHTVIYIFMCLTSQIFSVRLCLELDLRC
jgi:hypothetical protein